jgi:hypothetical protein
LPLDKRLLVWLIVSAIKTGDFIWLAHRIAKTLNLEINTKDKTWRISSEAAFDPSFQKRTFDDVYAIFKADPYKYYTEEERNGNGRLVRYVVSTEAF